MAEFEKRTDDEFLQSLLRRLQRPPRRRRTNIQRIREHAEASAAEEAAARMRERRRSRRWIEKRPGQLHSIREQLRAGDSSRLSATARRMLVLIARRPDVTSSRRWTTAKASRVTINADMVRSHFHHWAASVARNAVITRRNQAAELAAAELKRQEDAAYASLEAAYYHEQRELERRELRAQERLYQRGLPPAVDAPSLARLVDRGAELREDARLEALEAKELNDVPAGPWIALDDVPALRVLDGGRVPE